MCQNPLCKDDVFLRRHFIEFESGTWDRCKNHAITYFKGLVSIFLTVYIIMILNFFFVAEKPFQKSTYLDGEVCLFWLLQEAASREMRRKQCLFIFLLLFFVLICTFF